MPKIPRRWLDSAVYIFPDAEAARSGRAVGATGFLTSYPTSEPIDRLAGHVYVVSNAHAVPYGSSSFVRLNDAGLATQVVEISDNSWHRHPDGADVVVAPLPLPTGAVYATVGQDMFLTHDRIVEFDIGSGDDVFFFGRFMDVPDVGRNVITLRTGTLASDGVVPISQPMRAHTQDCFLVEAFSLSGYSGSPVFVSLAGYVGTEQGQVVINPLVRSPCFLLGIDTGHLSADVPVMRNGVRDQGASVVLNAGMAAVLPAWKIVEVLELDVLAAMRRGVEGHFRARN